MVRITRKDLEQMLTNINRVCGTSYWIDFSSIYGGYQLWKDTDDGSLTVVSYRMTGKELRTFFAGYLLARSG